MAIYNQEFFMTVSSRSDGDNGGGNTASVSTRSTMGVAAVQASRNAAPPTAEHLVGLVEGEWALWRWVALRGAGFPARQVLRLAAPDCAAEADVILDAEAEARRARLAAMGLFGESLDALGSAGQWDDKKRRNGLLNAVRILKSGKLPAASVALSDAENAAVEAARSALARVEELKAGFEKTYAAAGVRISKELNEVAGAEQFREAVTWQNRQAVRGGIDALLRMPADSPAEGAKRRRHEAAVASYLQRYCVKNDTIGFFGPVGWATLNPRRKELQVSNGASLLAARRVYFEDWAIDALVAVLNKRPALRRWFAPRRLPFVYLDGDTLYVPMRRPLRLAAKHAAVLRQCNGDLTAQQIAQASLRNRANGMSSEQEVYAILEGLCMQKLIRWQLEVALDAYPERRLRRLLERVEDEELRALALAPLDELERARDAVTAAAGDAARLDAALGDLDEKFTALTGEASTRAAGRTYAARTLVYEDCRRSTQVEIGSALIDELSPALILLLQSARWFTYEAAKVLRAELRDVYRELVKKQNGNRSIDGFSFWMQAQARLFEGSEGNPMGVDMPLLDGVQEGFQKRWADVFALEEGARRVTLRSDEIRERAQQAFAAPHSGWGFGKYHSPDVMIAAESLEAISRGDYQFVMGELHLGNNTVGNSVFFEQHERAQELVDNVERDLPEVRAVPMTPREWMTARINFRLIPDKDYRLEFTLDSFHPERDKTIALGELQVEESGDNLVARTRDGRLSFDLVEIFGGMFSGFVVNQFKLLRSLPHTPRITIDRLVVARETWRFPADALAFADVKDEAERFVAARRWARAEGLPRFVFVKVPVETKPFYLDFASPVYVSLFAKMVRRTAQEGGAGAKVTVSEMIPGLEQVWLPDAAGERYTSELRIVAVDLAEVREGSDDLKNTFDGGRR